MIVDAEYKLWLREVNHFLRKWANGITTKDLPGEKYHEWYTKKVPSHAAAMRVYTRYFRGDLFAHIKNPSK